MNFRPHFPYFWIDSGEIRYRIIFRYAVVGFVKIGAVKTIPYFNEETQFCPNFMHLSSDLKGIRYGNIRNNLSKCEFRENRGCKNHTLVQTGNTIFPLFSSSFVRFEQNSVQEYSQQFEQVRVS